jgi:hypothetical protein
MALPVSAHEKQDKRKFDHKAICKMSLVDFHGKPLKPERLAKIMKLRAHAECPPIKN